MASGYDHDMPVGLYTAEPSSMFNGSAFQSALQTRVGETVLLPVYLPPILQGGSNAQFNIVAWAAFHIDSEQANGSSGTLTGHFTSYIAQGIQSTNWNPNNNGIRVIALVQ
jgi:hypothetical protein